MTLPKQLYMFFSHIYLEINHIIYIYISLSLSLFVSITKNAYISYLYIYIIYLSKNNRQIYIYIYIYLFIYLNIIYIYIYLYTYIHTYQRSAKPQLKNAIFGSKLSFLGVHSIVLQYIPIASFPSPGKLRAESLFTPPLQRLKHVWLPCAFLCSAPTVWYGMIPVNATANHSCTILSQTQTQVWIQLLEEVRMSSHSDMLHAFHSRPSVWVANHHHGPMLLPWLSSSRRKIAKPDLHVQVCRWRKHFWNMAWTKECWQGGLLSSSMLAWKRENTKRSSGIL